MTANEAPKMNIYYIPVSNTNCCQYCSFKTQLFGAVQVFMLEDYFYKFMSTVSDF